jgi:hypothetical protein
MGALFSTVNIPLELIRFEVLIPPVLEFVSHKNWLDAMRSIQVYDIAADCYVIVLR